MIQQEDIDAMKEYNEPASMAIIDQTRDGVMDMVIEFSAILNQPSNPSLYASLIQEEYNEWRSEYLQDTTVDQLKEVSDLVYVLYGYANARGWDLDEAVARVHENNIGRCFQPDGSIKRREDGKIMKNKDYPKVYLEDLV